MEITLQRGHVVTAHFLLYEEG